MSEPSNDELRAAGFTIPREGTLYEYEWDADTGEWVPVVDAPTRRLVHREGCACGCREGYGL